ncbi:MAG: acetyltransferase [uncultured bacterium]|uniref:PglD N-terminal domain-containing protein n=1 Tax=Candidatus Gottesmanbacteria bacterium RIFCSPLOWO2_01_FULL_43_11b TaxID=1798392 RepID=A0A1F6AII1_9BACT|nr:MAG: acetyltransferase [uncultured bacterium]OGG24505.1 MAG: hypothetical protein A3A79_04960 [Candidatus Gottesmanbacteria bacterium RIFCSPLOWO2_01_FULL_43_11b]
MKPKNVIFWGGTGQAKVVRPIIEAYGGKLVAVFDDNPKLPPPFPDVPLFYGKKGFEKWMKSHVPRRLGFCITIGNPHGRVRVKFHNWLVGIGLTPVTVIHPTAFIADNAVIGDGCQFMAGASVGVQAQLGKECIINTNASVDHECVLGDGVGVAPGATLCGEVKVGINGWIGAGATVLPRITIGADSIVGAGAVVIRDVPSDVTVVGVPAK